MIDAQRWEAVLRACGVRALISARWAPLFERYVQPEYFSAGRRELDDFVAQVLHETCLLEQLAECLIYSADRIRQLGNASAPGSRWRSLVPIADRLAHNPQAFAEAAYGGRMGNDRPGDGYRYAGRGIPQVTGRDNYRLLQSLTGLDLLEHPEMLLEPETALRCAVLWWERQVPDSAIDSLERVTRAVNGGTVGLADRGRLQQIAQEALA